MFSRLKEDRSFVLIVWIRSLVLHLFSIVSFSSFLFLRFPILFCSSSISSNRRRYHHHPHHRLHHQHSSFLIFYFSFHLFIRIFRFFSSHTISLFILHLKRNTLISFFLSYFLLVYQPFQTKRHWWVTNPYFIWNCLEFRPVGRNKLFVWSFWLRIHREEVEWSQPRTSQNRT